MGIPVVRVAAESFDDAGGLVRIFGSHRDVPGLDTLYFVSSYIADILGGAFPYRHPCGFSPGWKLRRCLEIYRRLV